MDNEILTNELYAVCFFYLSACESIKKGEVRGLKYKAIFDFVKTVKSLGVDYGKGNLKDVEYILRGVSIECKR